MKPIPGASNQGSSPQSSRAPDHTEIESLRQVEDLLDTLEDRWAGYWQEMQSLLSTVRADATRSEKNGGRPRPQRIRSAVYGDIDLKYPELMYLVDMPYVQRLRQISQMGLVHFVYPEARHSRFDHTLGVAWNVHQICSSLGQKRVSTVEQKTLLAAAILHDVGHGPFSHCTEMWEESLSHNDRGVWGWSAGKDGMSAYHEFPERSVKTKKGKAHEVNGVRLIYDHPIAGALVRRGLQRIGTDSQRSTFQRDNSLGIGTLLGLLGIDPVAVSCMIVGDRGNGGALVDIINGDLDADKFDYYQRDAYFTGAGQAGADVEYIIHNVRLVDLPDRMGGDKALAWPQKAVNDLVFNLISRRYFYVNTANHPVAQDANAMLATAFFEGYRALQDACLCLDAAHPNRDIAGRFLAYLPFMEDQDIWQFLDTMSKAESQDPYRQDCCRVVSLVSRRLRARSLFRRSAPLLGREGNDFTQGIEDALVLAHNKQSADSRESMDFVYLIDHRGHTGHADEKLGDSSGITLIDWGWSPANRMTIKEFNKQKKKLFGYNKRGGRPSVCIIPSDRSRIPISLSEALDDSGNVIASGTAKYEHSMSFVQVLDDDTSIGASGDGQRIPVAKIAGIADQVRTEYGELLLSGQPTNTACLLNAPRHDPHGADTHRIGPIRARPEMVVRAIENLLL